jgi:hypothetical protein
VTLGSVSIEAGDQLDINGSVNAGDDLFLTSGNINTGGGSVLSAGGSIYSTTLSTLSNDGSVRGACSGGIVPP